MALPHYKGYYHTIDGLAQQSSTKTITLDVRISYHIESLHTMSSRDEYKLTTRCGIREVITYEQKCGIEKAVDSYRRGCGSPILQILLIDHDVIDRRNKLNLEHTVQQQMLQKHVQEIEQEQLIKHKQKLLLL